MVSYFFPFPSRVLSGSLFFDPRQIVWGLKGLNYLSLVDHEVPTLRFSDTLCLSKCCCVKTSSACNAPPNVREDCSCLDITLPFSLPQTASENSFSTVGEWFSWHLLVNLTFLKPSTTKLQHPSSATPGPFFCWPPEDFAERGALNGETFG